MPKTHYDTECPTCPYCDHEDEFEFFCDKEDYLEPDEVVCSACNKEYELGTNVIGGVCELWSVPLEKHQKAPKKSKPKEKRKYKKHTWTDDQGRQWSIVNPANCSVNGETLLPTDYTGTLSCEILLLACAKYEMLKVINSVANHFYNHGGSGSRDLNDEIDHILFVYGEEI